MLSLYSEIVINTYLENEHLHWSTNKIGLPSKKSSHSYYHKHSRFENLTISYVPHGRELWLFLECFSV